ncbi:complex I subunit 4 family protein [Sandaracinus amylolyticus]|uniref:NADH-ubiquinone oxidoreductase chain M n=1 Tax=Sandaracinus amylolyticus TaxID=927083 RepID=A0A0F6SDU2_9BACT|nr:proton-conducting transporter membrane subunit [Sandaracinus amylolyticus]AKF04039.1 NADH-ubiquinone oxidoreductase chain M [Sandaracinus amylolyticus]
MSAPVLTILIALPALGALALPVIRDERSARVASILVAAATFTLASAIALSFARTPGAHLVELGPSVPLVGARWHLGVDGLAAPFLPLASLLALGVLVAAPREETRRGSSVAVLLTLSMTLGVYLALDVLLLTAFWIACLVPGAMELHRARRIELARMVDVYLVLGSLPIVAAAIVIGVSRASAGAALPFDLANASAAPMPPSGQHVVFVLLALAVLIRKAITPFHSWMPVLIERGPIGIATMIAGTHLGAFLVARLMIPLLPEAARADLPLLAGLALVSALYNAFVALSQHDMRRMLGFVVTSQLGLVLVGLAEVDSNSVHGAMLQMVAVAITTAGMLVIAGAIGARCGTTEMRRLGGLAARFPRMAAAFFLLALAAIGLPGSLQYVAEDLLLHGLLDGHPFVATVLLVVTVLNGITLLRAFFTTFYGAAREPRLVGPEVRDLVARERVVVLAAIAIGVVSGVAPAPLLALRADAVRALAIASEHAGPDAPTIDAPH